MEGERMNLLEQKAQDFHHLNPLIFDELVEVCLDAQSAGQDRWSINAAFEVVRYNHLIKTQGDIYKLNNNFRAYYARWIMKRVPLLEDFFVIRKVQKGVV
jgi:hypothetical protein